MDLFVPTGWPEAVTRPRLPQNPACRFPAMGSSDVDSQYGDSRQLIIGVMQLWSKQRELLFDQLELLPPDRAVPAPAAQHLAPVMFHRPMDPQQCPKISGNVAVCIVTTEHLIEVIHLLSQQLSTAGTSLRQICGRLCATSTESRTWLDVCNCLTDEGGPLGTGLQEQVSNHLRRLRPKALVVSTEGKGLARTKSGDRQEEDRKETTVEVSKA